MRLDRMERLGPLLADSSGEARFVAGIEFDRQGRVTILIEVEADLPLICQCSLEPYIEPVRRQSLLGVMEDMSEEALMPANYEPVLMQHGRLALLDLVEDELLLGLPQVPRNPEFDASRLAVADQDALTPGGADSEASLQQPFAGLAEQLKNMRRT